MNYAGITVGPVTGTLSLTSTPAGLWAASYFFSSFVRELCMGLQKEGATVLTLPDGYVVEEHLAEHKGIGLYHDRVYLMADKEPQEIRSLLLGARDKAISVAASDLGTAVGKSAEKAKSFLMQYIQFHYVIVQEAETKEKGLAKTLADALDALELVEHAQAKQDENLFILLLRDDKNESVRGYPPLVDAADANGFALARKDEGKISLTDLPRIAKGKLIPDEQKTAWGKTDSYFAIVQADGDNMGQLLAASSGEDEITSIRHFSKLCMDYAVDAAEKVTGFGGAMIYAGGDDLLFLAPVIGAGGRTVWELCQEIDESFKKFFAASPFSKRELPTPPSMSFGVSVNYVKFPLYEAFKDAQRLLFGTAKRAFFHDKARKNNMAVQVQKHSGQASGFLVSLKSESLDKFITLLNEFFKKDGKNADKANQTMHSVLYHIENQKAAFAAAMADDNAKDTIRNAFVNAFDNAGQLLGREQNEAVANLAAAITADYADKKVKQIGEEDKKYKALFTLTSMLRVAKLLAEGGKARE